MRVRARLKSRNSLLASSASHARGLRLCTPHEAPREPISQGLSMAEVRLPDKLVSAFKRLQLWLNRGLCIAGLHTDTHGKRSLACSRHSPRFVER